MEAVKQGSAAIGLKSKTHAILVALKVRLFVAQIVFCFDKVDIDVPVQRKCTFCTKIPGNSFDPVFTIQRAPSELSSHQKKILHIDDHVGIAIAGLTADARGLRYLHFSV